MALAVRSERFEHAIIDLNDMTITEYGEDFSKCYNLMEVLKRWDGVVDINLTIQRCVPLPPDGRDD